MEDLGFIILNCSVAHSRLGGCGHKTQTTKGLGLAFLLLFLIRPGLSSMLQSMPLSEMERKFYSGQIDG